MISAMPAEALPNDSLPAPSSWKRLAIIATLVVFAAFEIWVGWTSTIPDSVDRSTLYGFLIIAHILGQMLLGSMALLCALFGRARYAIILLAANIVLGWLTADLFDPGNWRITSLWSAQETIVNLVLMPIAGLVAGSFAARNIRLGWATLLVCLPTLYVIVVMVGFTIIILTHGF
jgi:hypothetical protein